jgi:GNAT superfamily N-acetyltransferase
VPTLTVHRETPVVRTPRVIQTESIFDIPPSSVSAESWEVDVELPEEWNVGLIVGPSGAGKSTVAGELFGDSLVSGWEWPADRSILDGFPASMGVKEITSLLSSVGFSSAPLWVRPYHVLSNGQRFRVDLARTLAEQPHLAVVDEFSSVVDRTVAQIGSAAVSKAVRRRGGKFVAVSCHYDIAEWLEPDWVYEPHLGALQRGRSLRRPRIDLEVRRVHHSCWELFRPYHYLNHTFNKAARCFVAFYEGRPVALQAVIVSPHPVAKNMYRGHRAVCLPDYQGVGIGNALIDYVASAYRGLGLRILSTTASPALIQSRSRSPNWACIRPPRLAPARGRTAGKSFMAWTPSVNRLTSTWEYVGARMDAAQARALIYGEAER